ncbi:dTDP-glucose 4,6-dehydratase [Candidatus Methylopumilus universalis]|uniref:dTDP-glucose 4,6-dehydratase n=1 Tax=Candidatus Methylopumilus universalis TaxID=2588536 RepID=A0AAX1F0G4_9PROT|nr:dTDP-glucose 4,6-dehydratase [Candidatus Methylopumilus universalis]QDC41256.1 dTDP-glucose 4,6-dehydratase [Candidatus Methylopumilus universalis]QDC42546.1 dTDP-glucose 4,6-dehydratase [Candidatus Methylopumilus universalis]QDC54932.1 dTDP-glucose 4,6-dehydratase [Candidatus Methylopumilus universalis]QDC56213.1 dTDP-glucose 4,6-dehydratase [Candidatus Methylopumilus universalis]QDC57495.1 dTDP-glucose 4,6-dehydratase [Candidatus Methylopumilus universalis]
MTILVTGAAGFIGSNFVLDWLNQSKEDVVSLDLLTYAGNLENLSSLSQNSNHHFIQGSIGDRNLVSELLKKYQVGAIVNFAAESHVDRSIHESKDFIETNIVGTYNLLESARSYWNDLDKNLKQDFRFLHVSSDEVYGSLNLTDPPSNESDPYKPNSPYSASKAASDHLVRAWFQTYKLPVLTVNSANNYGPFQFPEKLIPLSILNALNDKPLPIYADGQQVRDWLYVKDHCSAIREILINGQIGETYNVGGRHEKTNLEVVETLCAILDELKPKSNGKSYVDQITFVKDRLGHDKRYAIDASKLERELDWRAQETFETGLRKTVLWYLDHEAWMDHVVSGEYQEWVKKQYS